jgi:hypothetical protein
LHLGHFRPIAGPLDFQTEPSSAGVFDSKKEAVAMDESKLRLLVRERAGLRIEPKMINYFLRKAGESDRPVALIGSDARNGLPRRQIVDPLLIWAAAFPE